MKTHGICHAQSARKHRKAGHLVQELGDGRRYQWQSQGIPQMFGRGWRVDPTHVIADDIIRPYQKELSNRIAKAGSRQLHACAKGFDVPVVMGVDPGKATAKIRETRAVHPDDGKTVLISVGDRYWPKRRNQHSKTYRVVGFRDDGSVIFARGDDVVSGTMDADAFLAVIGKRAL